MTTNEAIRHFGSQYKVAAALGIKQPSVAAWGKRPPPIRQLQIEALTLGQLKADADCDAFRFPVAAKVAA